MRSMDFKMHIQNQRAHLIWDKRSISHFNLVQQLKRAGQACPVLTKCGCKL